MSSQLAFPPCHPSPIGHCQRPRYPLQHKCGSFGVPPTLFLSSHSLSVTSSSFPASVTAPVVSLPFQTSIVLLLQSHHVCRLLARVPPSPPLPSHPHPPPNLLLPLDQKILCYCFAQFSILCSFFFVIVFDYLKKYYCITIHFIFKIIFLKKILIIYLNNGRLKSKST